MFRSLFNYTIVFSFLFSFQCFGTDLKDLPAKESVPLGSAKLHMDGMMQDAAIFRRQKSTAPTRFVPIHESPVPADELAEAAAKLHMDGMMQDAAIFRRQKSTAPTRFVPCL